MDPKVAKVGERQARPTQLDITDTHEATEDRRDLEVDEMRREQSLTGQPVAGAIAVCGSSSTSASVSA